MLYARMASAETYTDGHYTITVIPSVNGWTYLTEDDKNSSDTFWYNKSDAIIAAFAAKAEKKAVREMGSGIDALVSSLSAIRAGLEMGSYTDPTVALTDTSDSIQKWCNKLAGTDEIHGRVMEVMHDPEVNAVVGKIQDLVDTYGK